MTCSDVLWHAVEICMGPMPPNVLQVTKVIFCFPSHHIVSYSQLIARVEHYQQTLMRDGSHLTFELIG